jgi:hypothetical protein
MFSHPRADSNDETFCKTDAKPEKDVPATAYHTTLWLEHMLPGVSIIPRSHEQETTPMAAFRYFLKKFTGRQCRKKQEQQKETGGT